MYTSYTQKITKIGFSVERFGGYEMFRESIEKIGESINITDIKPSKNRRGMLNSLEAMSLHTDNPDADIIGWYCVEQSEYGGASLLSDFEEIKTFMSHENVLAYKSIDVVDAFCDAFAVSRAEAEDIFNEMLKFLWLCRLSDNHLLKVIDTPILIIDEMWHTFILFTKEYSEFSNNYFGRYIHHAPTTRREKEAQREKRSTQDKEVFLEEKRERYRLIYEMLGRDTFIKWFHVYPDIYAPDNIKNLRRK